MLLKMRKKKKADEKENSLNSSQDEEEISTFVDSSAIYESRWKERDKRATPNYPYWDYNYETLSDILYSDSEDTSESALWSEEDNTGLSTLEFINKHIVWEEKRGPVLTNPWLLSTLKNHHCTKTWTEKASPRVVIHATVDESQDKSKVRRVGKLIKELSSPMVTARKARKRVEGLGPRMRREFAERGSGNYRMQMFHRTMKLDDEELSSSDILSSCFSLELENETTDSLVESPPVEPKRTENKDSVRMGYNPLVEEVEPKEEDVESELELRLPRADFSKNKDLTQTQPTRDEPLGKIFIFQPYLKKNFRNHFHQP